MRSLLTAIEEDMYARGYVSSRMAAFKLKKSFKTVLRQIQRGQFKAVRVGQQQFITMESIRAWYEERSKAPGSHVNSDAVKILGLDDWDDVFYVDEEDRIHVRSED